MLERFAAKRETRQEQLYSDRLEQLICNGQLSEEQASRCASFVAQIKQRTGIDTPWFRALNNHYYGQPAVDLIAKHNNQPDPYRCRFGGVDLVISHGVFCPTLTLASQLLLDAIGDDFRPSERVLDVFAGSGAFGIIAAKRGAGQIVSVDISNKAIADTLHNAKLNGVETQVSARLGTLHQTINPDEQFDLIIAQPPLLAGIPRSQLEAAIYDDALQSTKDFIDDLPDLMSAGGRAYVMTSNVLFRQGYDISQAVWDKGFWWPSVAAELDRETEHYTAYRIDQWPDV